MGATNGSPQLAREAMVSSASEAAQWGAKAPPKETRPSISAGGTHMASKSGPTSAVRLAIGSQDPLLVSFDQSMIHTLLS